MVQEIGSSKNWCKVQVKQIKENSFLFKQATSRGKSLAPSQEKFSKTIWLIILLPQSNLTSVNVILHEGEKIQMEIIEQHLKIFGVVTCIYPVQGGSLWNLCLWMKPWTVTIQTKLLSSPFLLTVNYIVQAGVGICVRNPKVWPFKSKLHWSSTFLLRFHFQKLAKWNLECCNQCRTYMKAILVERGW